jgi:hypothetical protein
MEGVSREAVTRPDGNIVAHVDHLTRPCPCSGMRRGPAALSSCRRRPREYSSSGDLSPASATIPPCPC